MRRAQIASYKAKTFYEERKWNYLRVVFMFTCHLLTKQRDRPVAHRDKNRDKNLVELLGKKWQVQGYIKLASKIH
jgi:hypothetical protein